MASSCCWAVIYIACVALCIADKYNLIDASPSCIERGLCPHLTIGGSNSIHPNPVERMEYLLRNIARIYPLEYLSTPYGAHAYGTYGPSTYYACGGEATQHPIYWLSEANQVTRAHQYWNSHCNSTGHSHNTCPQYCHLFRAVTWLTPNICGYVTRTYNFVTDLGLGSVGSEGIWGANVGYTSSGHCGMVFNAGYDNMGIGYWPGTSITMVGIYNGPFHDYPLPQGVHFDERTRIHSDDYNTNGSHLTFMLQFHGRKQEPPISAEAVYLLYDGAAHLMEHYVGHKNRTSDFYRLLFDTKGLQQCLPYAFYVVDNNTETWRLPESDLYFYATYNPPNEEQPSICNENHYYWNGNQWRLNSSPQVDNILEATLNCTGCAAIPALVSIWKQHLGPTPAPSASPTDAPTKYDYAYILDTEAMTWSEANAACYDRYGSELASLYDDASAEILLELAGSYNIWIGLNDYDVEGEWMNADGSSCNGLNCINVTYWMEGEPSNSWNDQHAGFIDGTTANGDIYNMIADTRGYYNSYRFICNPQRTKHPTAETLSPTTFAPTVPSLAPSIPQTCGDYQCLNISGLSMDDLNGEWRANGYSCISDKSYYTKDGVDDVYLCLVGNHWTFTDALCETDDSRKAYCTKTRAEISYCDASSAWMLLNENNEYELVVERVSIDRSYDICQSQSPTQSPSEYPTVYITEDTAANTTVDSKNGKNGSLSVIAFVAIVIVVISQN